MPALIPTKYAGTITYLGLVPNRDTPEITTIPLHEMRLTLAGMDGEVHAGLTRPSCSRVSALYPRYTTISNTRQLAIVSAEELAEIATGMGMDDIDPAWLGASVVISGIPDFSHIPPSARLQIAKGATLVVDMQNRPCQFPARTIEQARKGLGKKFKPAAEGKRGVTAWVEREGMLRIGDPVTVFIPDQREWRPDAA